MPRCSLHHRRWRHRGSVTVVRVDGGRTGTAMPGPPPWPRDTVNRRRESESRSPAIRPSGSRRGPAFRSSAFTEVASGPLHGRVGWASGSLARTRRRQRRRSRGAGGGPGPARRGLQDCLRPGSRCQAGPSQSQSRSRSLSDEVTKALGRKGQARPWPSSPAERPGPCQAEPDSAARARPGSLPAVTRRDSESGTTGDATAAAELGMPTVDSRPCGHGPAVTMTRPDVSHVIMIPKITTNLKCVLKPSAQMYCQMLHLAVHCSWYTL